ncbi:MAG: hypothetical protein RLZZ148_2202 [Cyanobacteriota bacterium]
MQLLFWNISPLLLLILSKSIGILCGSWYATVRFVEIRCSAQCSWSTPSKKIGNLSKRIADFSRSKQPPSNLRDWVRVYESVKVARGNILLSYMLFTSFFWLFFEFLDNLPYLSSKFDRMFSPFSVLTDIAITASISYLLLSCDASDPEARGGLIIDIIKLIQNNILSRATLTPKIAIDRCLSRYEVLEFNRFCNSRSPSGEIIIEDVNILITEIPDTFIQKQYRQKFQELREAIEGRKITHDDLSFQPRYNPESAKKRLLIVYIEMSLDLAPILYQ